MPEILSRQAAAIAANTKRIPAYVGGKKRVLLIQTPASHALAQNDTIASGVRIPAGTRFLSGSIARYEAFGTGVTLSVGLRNWKTKEVISASNLANAVGIATAGQAGPTNGTAMTPAQDYVTPVDTEVFLTIGGAAPNANAQLRVELEYLNTD